MEKEKIYGVSRSHIFFEKNCLKSVYTVYVFDNMELAETWLEEKDYMICEREIMTKTNAIQLAGRKAVKQAIDDWTPWNVLEEIVKLLDDDSYDTCYGIRADDYEYQVGDVCHNSHQLYDDPWLNDENELVFSYCEDGIYAGRYDAGELDGTSAIEIYVKDENKKRELVKNAIKDVTRYLGKNLYLIKGTRGTGGEDINELIISDAVVVGKFERIKEDSYYQKR